MSGSAATAPKQSHVDSGGHVSMSTKRSAEVVSLHSVRCMALVADTQILQLHDLGSGSTPQHARLRQPGIREHTDESCDLPKRYDIIVFV